MAVGPEERVAREDLAARLDEVLRLANGDEGPVAITDGDEVVAYVVGREMMDLLHELTIAAMLKKRMKEPTVSHEQVVAESEAIIRAAQQLPAARPA